MHPRLTAALLAGATACAAADTGAFYPVDPATTFQHTCEDPAGLPLVIDLDAEGYAPGDMIRVTAVGDFAFVPGGPEDGTGAIAVFSSDGVVDPDRSLEDRVPGAILSDAPDFPTGAPLRCPGETTEIPEDFLCDGVEVTVPDRGDGRAAFLIVTAFDEYYSDNDDPGTDFGIVIEFGPVLVPVLPVISTFDSGPDGWVFTNTTDTSWRSTGGNPDGYVRTEDLLNPGPILIAPESYCGDWSTLDNAAKILVDHRVFNPGSGITNYGELSVRISGPGGQATWDDPYVPAGSTGWLTREIQIVESEWVVEGEWECILADVRSFEVFPELNGNNSGLETNGVDNVVLSWITPCNSADLAEPFGLLDLTDVTAFTTGFVAMDPIADLNADGLYDLSDINLFVTSFLAGCP